MDLGQYFKNKEGAGYLARSNSKGEVNVAIYSQPHVMPDGNIAFGMSDRLTHKNLMENSHAVYAFKDNGYQGVRLYLQRVKEETEGPIFDEIRREALQSPYAEQYSNIRFVEYFRVAKDLPLTENTLGLGFQSWWSWGSWFPPF